MPNPLSDVFEKYGHLDKLLSDKQWLGEGIRDQILFDLWQAVKLELEAMNAKSI